MINLREQRASLFTLENLLIAVWALFWGSLFANRVVSMTVIFFVALLSGFGLAAFKRWRSPRTDQSNP